MCVMARLAFPCMHVASVNNTKRFSLRKSKWLLILVVIEIEPGYLSRPGPGHPGNHAGKRMLEAKPLTLL